MKESQDISFYQLLVNNNITELNNVLAIRSSLHSPTLLLKRIPI